jgi:peroxiredoxin
MKNMLSLVLTATLAAGFTGFVSADDKAPSQPAGVQNEAPVKGAKAQRRGPRPEKAAEAASGEAKVGEAAPNFTLKTTDGKEWSLSDAKGKVVVLEWVNPECPVCVRVMKDGTVANTLKECKAQFGDVVYVAINSSASRPASLKATESYLKTNKIEIPALLDEDGKVGKMYGARTTPHCYVIDANGVLVYQGAIDDAQDGDGKKNFVVNAVTALKKGEAVSPSSTRPYGCGVKY